MPAPRSTVELIYAPMPKQAQFHRNSKRFRLYCGGMGCVGAETKINGIPIAEFSGGNVKTLFGEFVATRSYVKGVADLYRVTTLQGKKVVVTKSHRFLTVDGWKMLSQISCGTLIAVSGTSHEVSENKIQKGFQDYCCVGSHLNDELPNPVQVACQDKLRQLRKIDGDNNAQYHEPFHVYRNSYFDHFVIPNHEVAFEHGYVSDVCELPQKPFCQSDQPYQQFADRLSHFHKVKQEDCRQTLLDYSDHDQSEYRSYEGFLKHVVESFQTKQQPCFENEVLNKSQLYLGGLSYTNIAQWDEISKIEFVRNDIFYDLSVPFAEHYEAEGIYHHNSGKSFAGCAEVITLSLQYAGNFGLVGRATYPELRDTTWRELLRFPVKVHGKPYEFIHSPLIRSYNKANHEIVLFNGSTIIGRALDDSIDKLGKGLNLGFVYVDELTEIDEATWLSITVGRLRLKLPCNTCGIMPEGDSVKCPKCKKTTIFHTAFGTTNPEGHDWVWKRWISSPNEEHWYVQVNTRDNQYLPKDYVDNLIKQFPEEWVKRYVDGSFDTFEGLVYKDFKDAEPYVVNPFPVPDSWYRFIGLDHGYRNPTAILFGAVDNNGTLWIYDEYYEKGKTVSQIADVIKTKVGEQEIEKYLIDPATRQNKGLNGDKTIFGEFEEEGIFFDCANNQVPAGINRVQQKLMLDAEKQPKIKIFRSCFNLRNELQTYRYADIKPNAVSEEGKEKPVKKDDHLVDALRYMVNYMYDTPKLTKKKREYDYKEMLHNVQQDNNEHWMAS